MTRYFSPDPQSDLLMWDMIEALDIDLPAAIRSETLAMETLCQMARNCGNCPAPQLCAVYLESRDGTAQCAPSFCPNKARLADLRAVHKTPATSSGVPHPLFGRPTPSNPTSDR